MNIKEIKELIDLVTEKDIQELEFERGGERVLIRKRSPAPAHAVENVSPAAPARLPSPVAQQPAAAAPVTAPATDNLHLIKSPIVGTFYRGSSPDAEPFVQVGSRVEKGMVLCIIEAMKLMNEIESDVAGQVASIYVEDGQPVEYGEHLFAIRLG